MQTIGQTYHRDKLAKLLATTSLRDVIGMVWCAWAIQNDRADYARRYMRFSDAVTDGSVGAEYAIHPWQLESLINEALTARHRTNPRRRELTTQDFSTILRLVRRIGKIEGADDRAFLQDNDVLYEVHRLSQRQFEWQRGYLNMARSYRSMAMFGQGATAGYFAEQVGCSVSEFFEAGFLLFAGATNSPTRVWRDHALPAWSRADVLAKVLDRMSIDSEVARAEAIRLRSAGDHAGYKPSVLRRHPILRFGRSGEEAMAPLPLLIPQRITSGLYLDIVGGGGAIWQDVGRRFEHYCLRYLDAMLPGHEVRGEHRYGPKGRQIDTPDVLVSRSGSIRMAVECKARHMPVDARFSGDPVGDAEKSYAEIAKGIFQIWRFNSHGRRGVLDLPVDRDCLGIVLTADPWLAMGQKLHPEVMALAHQLADRKEREIIPADRRRVPVVMIDDLEYVLQHAGHDAVLDRLTEISRDDSGWEWSLVHGVEKDRIVPYPFAGELEEMLPNIYARDASPAPWPPRWSAASRG